MNVFSCDSVHFCLPCTAKSVKIHGTKYTSGAVIRVQTPPQFDPAPFLYCQVQDIYVYKDYKIFKSEVMDVVEYTENLRAVKIIPTKHYYVHMMIYIVMVFYMLSKKDNIFISLKGSFGLFINTYELN